MEELTGMLAAAAERLWQEPRLAVGVVVAAGLLYYLLQRKSRVERDAEKRLSQLKQDKAGHYDHLRPPH